MRWAIAALVVAAASVVVVFVLAVGATRDTVPERLRTCATDGGAGVIRSEADLGAQLRSDAGAGAVRETGRTRLGEDTAVLLQGTNYRILVLAGRKSPSLEGDLARRLVSRAADYALVVKEADPLRGILRGCVSLAAGR